MSTYINPNNPKPLKYEDCPPLLGRFVRHMLTMRNLAPRSVNSYYIDIWLFLRFYARLSGFVQENTPLDEIFVENMSDEIICNVTSEDITAFLFFLADDRQNSARTRAHKLSSLNAFYKYILNTEQLIEENPCNGIDAFIGRRSQQPIYLTVDQSKQLLESVSGEFPERDFCIIVLFLSCGMRLSELTGINLDDISESRIKLRGKGRKERTAFLNELCMRALRNYLAVRNEIPDIIDEKALFISKRTLRRMGARGIEKMLAKQLAKADLTYTGCTPHKLRHSAATQLLQGGASVLELAAILGHESMATTQIYTHLQPQTLQDAVNNAPLNSDFSDTNKQ